MYRDILLAYDGSRDSREALHQGAELACICNARVLLLAVVSPAENMLPVEGMSCIVQHEHDKITADLLEGQAALHARGLTSETRLSIGNPAEQITTVAREIGADLVVIGHRNQSSLVRWWNGSVGASILGHAPCSILVAVQTPVKLADVRGRKSRASSSASSQPAALTFEQGAAN